MSDPLLETYRQILRSAYHGLREELALIASWQNTPKAVRQRERQIAAARCGQQVGACGKATRRDHVIAGLLAERAEGVDITPTVARHVMEKILGKGGDWRVLLQTFAESERTAARKSDACIEDLATLVGADMSDFLEEMRLIYKEERSEHLLTLGFREQ